MNRFYCFALTAGVVLCTFICSRCLTADDYVQTSSMGYGKNWDDATFWRSLQTGQTGAPSAGNNYYSDSGYVVRTLEKNGICTFSGDRLYLGYTATYDTVSGVVAKSISTGAQVNMGLKCVKTTVSDLYLGNAILQNSLGAGKTATVVGKITVEGTLGQIGAGTVGQTIIVESLLAGSGTLNLVSTGTPGAVNLTNTGNTFSGILNIGQSNKSVTANLTAGAFRDVQELNVLTSSTANIIGVAADLTVASKFSGGGSVNISGTAGTVTLNNGTTDFSGAWKVTGVTLEVTAPSALGTGAVTNNSTLAFDMASDGTYARVISGTGNVVKKGTGTLTFSSVQGFTDTTTVSGGTLHLGVANAIASSASVSVASGAAITFGAFDQTFKNLSGTGTISGTGALTLSNSSDTTFGGSLSAGSILPKGSIKINGTMSGSITSDTSGQLNLAGTLQSGDLTIRTGGTFSPGNSVGNFTLQDGAYLLESGATHLVEFALNGTDLEWDQLQVSEAVTLEAGSILSTLGITDGMLDDETRYELISSKTNIFNEAVFDLPGWELAVRASEITGYATGLFLQKPGAPVPGVPEPSTWLLLLAGGLWLFQKQTRRGRSVT